MAHPQNFAAVLEQAQSKLNVREVPYTPPSSHQIVIKNSAIAINPADWKIQKFVLPFIPYPTVLGFDVAGTVAQVGDQVTRFKVGDRVLGQACGGFDFKMSEGAFQNYTVVPEDLASEIPGFMSFEEASVIPVGLTTAAFALYSKIGNLELPLPTLNPVPTGKVLLVWGGASSVGSNAVQLAISSGFEVFTTCSLSNFEYASKKLKASRVFDYKSETVVQEIVEALKGKTIAGVLDAVTVGKSTEFCAEILKSVEGTKAIVSVDPAAQYQFEGIKFSPISITSIPGTGIDRAIFKDFLPAAMSERKFLPLPTPLVVGKGLQTLEDSFEVQKTVSAQKVVVTL
eukprot:TRINITY_DN7320_c0_g1_i1.p1 TRINITY_DN7320_c0_g1~~TRINITY_DN7320_c0_g1_i1.p1  ORF type:complete len:342 (-),score=78.91 TRINITY_DN7320_c0_g1_i1:442-1467(-)